MNHYRVSVSKTILAEIEEIADFIISISTPEHAVRYKNQLISEIATLSYMADTINYSQWKTAKRFHPKAKRLITKKNKVRTPRTLSLITPNYQFASRTNRIE